MTLSEALIIDLMMVKEEHLGQLLRYLRGRRVSRTMCHVNFIVWRRIVQCMPPQSNLYPTLKLKSRNETSKCRKKWLATPPHTHSHICWQTWRHRGNDRRQRGWIYGFICQKRGGKRRARWSAVLKQGALCTRRTYSDIILHYCN